MVSLTGSGSVSFRVFAPQASRVQLVGSFTGWQANPLAMERSEEGWHSVELPLDAGDYEFQYLMDGSIWLADYAAGGVRMNEYGTWVSTLHVPQIESRPAKPARKSPAYA